MVDFDKLNELRKKQRERDAVVKQFKVPAGAPANVVRVSSSGKWESPVRKDYITKQESIFEREEVYVDPLSTYHPDPITSAGRKRRDYARDGWYGFKRDGLVLLVPASRVELV